LAGYDGRRQRTRNQRRNDPAPRGQSPGTLNTVAVKSLDQTMKNIEQRGGKVCVPKMAIQKVGWLAYATDPGGNVFGIIEPDTNAK